MAHPRWGGTKSSRVRVNQIERNKVKEKVKETVKVIGEPVGRAGKSPFASRLVENINPLGRSSWFALAALAGSILRLFHRPRRRGLDRDQPGMSRTCDSDAPAMPCRAQTRLTQSLQEAYGNPTEGRRKAYGQRRRPPVCPSAQKRPGLTGTARKGGVCHE
jgi:hypothetical protein